VSDNLASKLVAAMAGDVLALAQALTLVERLGPKALAESDLLLNPPQQSFRVGVTGPPGAGKSTLIGTILRHFAGQKVAVLAVDPSSPLTQGAILGDRIRYSEHALNPNFFIRSVGSRGSLGGLSASAYLMLRVFDLCRFDWVIIETVGVGQVEVDIMNVADCVSLVLVPESGDSVQAMKAGLLEIADIIVVNKSDRPGAETFKNELESALNLLASEDSVKTEVLLMSATQGVGIEALVQRWGVAKAAGGYKARNQSLPRLHAEARALMRAQYEAQIETRIAGIHEAKDILGLLK